MFCVECDADFVLTKVITKVADREIIHSGGKSRVIYDLVNKHSNKKGIIDEDPGGSVPSIINRFKIISENSYHQIDVLYQKSKNNYLIILKPFLEAWILRAAMISEIDVEKYGLPDDATLLHSIINYRLSSFEKLLHDLMKVSPQIKYLEKLFHN